MKDRNYFLNQIAEDFETFKPQFLAFIGAKSLSKDLEGAISDVYVAYRLVIQTNNIFTGDMVFNGKKADNETANEIFTNLCYAVNRLALMLAVVASMPPEGKKLYNLWKEQEQQGDDGQYETLNKLHLVLIPLLDDACLRLRMPYTTPKVFLEMLSRGGMPMI